MARGFLMQTTYEFRIQFLGDTRPWEVIPPHDRQQFSSLTAAKNYAVNMATDPAIVEIRVNALGSLQGHYIPGTAEAREAHRASAEAAAMRGLALHEVF